ncbi:DNA primase [Burkholderia phage BcepNazgul]|uniref:DR0530-like primase n=1 Tax=Burkholderia phage BcepNazgul TaxID=242861 RepID=Q6UYG6_9CAUD|nr:DNA primase [Burkholderia phage BcepNazgul]AAQ63375.2 DR0530-like primase [Burkholderia phage BcepNazgul]
MADQTTATYLADHGDALIANGYNIVPITPGEKFPPHDGWQQTVATQAKLKTWLATGLKYTKNGEDRVADVKLAGVGFLTKNTPGVDIDISDEGFAKHMENFVHENFGMAPVRVGRAPRRLLLFRCTEPFSKVNSSVYLDEWGEAQKVEILANGQQFVAFHIHPDTKRPYEWLYKQSPLDIEASELPVLRRVDAQAIVDEFEKQAKLRGWTLKKRSRTAPERSESGGEIDYDDPFAADVAKTDIGEDELHAKLLLVPDADDYETWVNVGMALFHQYDGHERGLELWHEWSETADNYDAKELDAKWKSFDISNKSRTPITARYIIKLAKEAAEKTAEETMVALQKLLLEATSMNMLNSACKAIKKATLDKPSRELMVTFVRQAFKRINDGSPLPLNAARQMIRFENPESKHMPKWLMGWTYLTLDDKFYNVNTQEYMTRSAFNSAFERFLLTPQDVLEGRVVPDTTAEKLALNRHQIPVCRTRLYLPEQDETFIMNGARYANLYTDKSVPECPSKLTSEDKLNVKRILDHFNMMIPADRERGIFIDWLAWIIQTQKRPNWAIVLQGTESDGKTFFSDMMGVILGPENVKTLNAKTLEGAFNGWAEGSLLNCVEEIKLHGHNRFDVLNQIKPLITNTAIEIHRKGVDPYNTINTAAYLLLTNFKDALPLVRNDTRYFVMFGRMQNREDVEKFKDENPHYYGNLFQALNESAGALRKFFLEHEVSDTFDPMNRAPDSTARRYMIAMNRSNELEAIETLISESMEIDVSSTLLNASKLPDLMVGMDCELPQTKGLQRVLSDAGFTFLGRIRINGEYSRYWSKSPQYFMVDGSSEIDFDAVRQYAGCGL